MLGAETAMWESRWTARIEVCAQLYVESRFLDFSCNVKNCILNAKLC